MTIMTPTARNIILWVWSTSSSSSLYVSSFLTISNVISMTSSVPNNTRRKHRSRMESDLWYETSPRVVESSPITNKNNCTWFCNENILWLHISFCQHYFLVHWPQVPWMKVVKVNDAGLSVGVKVSLIELIKLSSWVMIIIWLDCDCSEALLLAKCIMMTITAACHWLLCQSPEILCQLNVVFISQEWVISPWNHRVIKLVTLVSR